jgi:protein O-mannosyl-transferase
MFASMNVRKVRSSSPQAPARESRRDFVLAALLVVAPLLVYAQVCEFGFIIVDDHAYVSRNVHVQQGLTRGSVAWAWTAVHDCNWIPLTWLSLMLDTEIYGFRPGGYHLTNVVLHAASALVLFATLVRATNRRGQSAFVAALFALHPLHVESVAWIAERKDVLSTLFGLLSLLMYVRYATGGQGRNLAGAFVLYVGSLLSKQTLVTLPFVFVLLDFWPLRRLGQSDETRDRRTSDSENTHAHRKGAWLLVEKIPFFAVAGVFSFIAVVTQTSGGAMAVRFPLGVRLLNAVVVYVAYLAKAFYPQNLAFYYPHPGARLSVVVASASAVLLLAITAGTIILRRRCPFLFVGWFWYLGTLVPTIGIVQIGIQQLADRYTYFPLIGIYLAVAWSAPLLMPAGPLRDRVLPITALASLLLFAATTFSQISYWHDSVTLLRHAMDCTPESSHGHELLGNALIADGDVSGGVDELQRAIRMAVPYAPLHHNLGAAFEMLGRTDDAVKEYEAALAIDARFLESRTRLESILAARRQPSEAKRSGNSSPSANSDARGR